MGNADQQHIFLELQVFQGLVAEPGGVVHQKFYRLRLTVGNPVNGYRRAGLILHGTNIPGDVVAAQFLGTDHAAQSQRVDHGVILHAAELGDYLRNTSALSVQRRDHIQFINPRQTYQRVHLGQALAFQQQMIRAVAVNHSHTWQLCRKLLTAGVILLNELDGNAVLLQ